MNQIPELLAPVGGEEQLFAAVENGADAVYLGGTLFNARMNASNFSKESLKEAVSFAHMRGVKVYLTLNILLSDSELPQALFAVEEAYLAGIDAVILQDMGFSAMVKRCFPDLPLHLSTQGTVYNAEGVRAACDMGFSRVVLAREVSLAEIERITKTVDTQIEVFVHGALCMSYSGQCQMSRYRGGRSGNRGVCAQPCRLPYGIYREDACMGEGYLLSPKDICTVNFIPGLCAAGVASLKIEGRMKSPEYVAVVTGVYRKYLDGYRDYGTCELSEEDLGILRQIFSRGAFSSGYLPGNPGKNLLSGSLPKHQGTPLGRVVSVNPEKALLEIQLTAPLSLGDGIEIQNAALCGNVVTYLRDRLGTVTLKSAQAGQRVMVGDIRGVSKPGALVYKITDKALLQRARRSYEGKSGLSKKELRRRKITLEFSAKVGQPALLTAWDQEGHRVSQKTQEIGEPAENRPLTGELVSRQLEKTGGTPFQVEACHMELDPCVALSVSVLNGLRREVLTLLLAAISEEEADDRKKKRMDRERMPEAEGLTCAKSSMAFEKPSEQKETEPKLSLYLFSADEETLKQAVTASFSVNGIKQKAKRICLPYQLFLGKNPLVPVDFGLMPAGKGGALRKEDALELMPFLPTVTRGGHDEKIRENLEELLELAKRRGIWVGNLGWLSVFCHSGAKVYGDYGLNLYNSKSLQEAKKWGLTGAVLSHEAFQNAEGDGQKIPLDFHGLEREEVLCGPIPLMESAHCPIGDLRENNQNTVKKCMFCQNGRYFIVGQKGERYPVLADPGTCNAKIFSENQGNIQTNMINKAKSKADYLRIYGIDKSLFCLSTLP